MQTPWLQTVATSGHKNAPFGYWTSKRLHAFTIYHNCEEVTLAISKKPLTRAPKTDTKQQEPITFFQPDNQETERAMDAILDLFYR